MGNDRDEILDLERRRCAAIGSGDLAVLRDCLADDYLHVGGAGSTSNKDAYIKTIAQGPRAPERGNLTVRLYGDAAVLTGDLLNKICAPGEPVKLVETFATQIAIRDGGKWRFVSFQLTQKRKPA